MTGVPLALEQTCTLVASVLSEGRRRGTRLMSGERRSFGTNEDRTVVSVPYPALEADWTLRTLTCGIALQCSPSKDRIALFPLQELSPREVRALTIIEGRVALGWVGARWPGLLPDLRRLLPGFESLHGDLEGPAVFERVFALARTNGELHCPAVLGQPPLGVPARGGVLGSIRRMAGRMPWSVRHDRVLPPGFDTTPVAGESNIRNPKLPPPSRPEDDDLIVRPEQRHGVPYPEWNLWTNSFLRDHVAVVERKHVSSSGPAKPTHAQLRRFFEEHTHRVMRNRLEDGADLDIDTYIEHHIDTVTGTGSDARVFRDLLPGRRDVATALLLDGSSSLGSSQGNVFKLELTCADALCHAMARARERHGLFVFNGKTRHRVNVTCLKDFSDAHRVVPSDLGLATGGYTRLGAPLRHLTHQLLGQPAERRLLIVIGDGMISDEGYEGTYAWADTEHAVEEADDAGVAVHYIGVGRARVESAFPRFSDRGVPLESRAWKICLACSRVFIASWSLLDALGETNRMRMDYQVSGTEVALFEKAYEQRLPVMLTGPTGCGKTRLVQHVGALFNRPVVTISCHDDLTSSDLVGRFMVSGGDVVWNDGPLTRALKDGAICYLDEVVEARHDSLAVLHSLTDHRRTLYLDRAGVVVEAPEKFMLVCSYNPAYRSSLKELKPSFRQRFVTIAMNYLPPGPEAEVLVHEAGIDRAVAERLVKCSSSIRSADVSFHLEPPSTRTLVAAAKLIAAGASELEAAEVCILAPLSSDGAIANGLRELAAATLLACR